MKKMKFHNIIAPFCAFVITALLLTLIQPPFKLHFLAWVAYVPFILISSPDRKLKTLLPVSFFVSAIYWLGNLYWIAPVTAIGWLVFCIYTALLWPMLVISVRFCRVRKMPLLVIFPILLVGIESLQGFLLGGFHWRWLGHSQYQILPVIQIADIFGAAGVSLLIALINAFIADLIIAKKQKKHLRLMAFAKTGFVAAALLAVFFYGKYRIDQSPRFIEKGPLVAAMQSNVPQSVKGTYEASETIFNDLLVNSKAATDAGAKLIIWPETMVQAILDEDVLMLLDQTHLYRYFHRILKNHAQSSAYLLIGASGAEAGFESDGSLKLSKRYNSAFLYTPDGNQAEEKYSKIHLVPFGETVPFRKSWPWLYRLLMAFTPYDFDYSLDAGTEFTRFDFKAGQKDYRFAVMICYEDTVAEIAREFVLSETGDKSVDFLVNISNDGWFVDFDNGSIRPSIELEQHAAICVFRAVENRLAIVRSVNTGISCVINSIGKIENGYISGNLPREASQRKAVAGWFADYVPIDKRITFFSKYGRWIEYICVPVTIVIVFLAVYCIFRRTKD